MLEEDKIYVAAGLEVFSDYSFCIAFQSPAASINLSSGSSARPISKMHIVYTDLDQQGGFHRV